MKNNWKQQNKTQNKLSFAEQKEYQKLEKAKDHLNEKAINNLSFDPHYFVSSHQIMYRHIETQKKKPETTRAGLFQKR